MEKNKSGLPKYFTSDVKEKCIIYELEQAINDGYSITAIYQPKKSISYDGSDSICEDVKCGSLHAVILEMKSDCDTYPESYKDQELTWFANFDNIDDVIVTCVL
jgi:hypothetical protein